jgi:hypothetical protein
MKIVWDRDLGTAMLDGQQFVITSEVRNELNGRRLRHAPGEVVRTVTNKGTYGDPYMPRPFPEGLWKITGLESTNVAVYAPIKILTNAHQSVQVWALDKDGGYDVPTKNFVEDYGYWLHWSQASRTTLGCGRVGTNTSEQVRELARLVNAALTLGEEVLLSVV